MLKSQFTPLVRARHSRSATGSTVLTTCTKLRAAWFAETLRATVWTGPVVGAPGPGIGPTSQAASKAIAAQAERALINMRARPFENHLKYFF
jgi:hypothetical protein